MEGGTALDRVGQTTHYVKPPLGWHMAIALFCPQRVHRVGQDRYFALGRCGGGGTINPFAEIQAEFKMHRSQMYKYLQLRHALTSN